ncbi:cytochrome b/b6 domain-containing protein [Desulfoluna spongiiphila]|uniref:Thiosulfate reductase cytochrome b subunit n=1 Tax=Desulfoluna spongiiphila TaxID=419481 RepID=A0A1G5BQY5_9BACT|nr:cytochrome b/b6 domain-containing protein [Desulfoluna spongiiphila]SCX92619.1 Thiosulfate reductase cytochrome b subunit [Desulfoluna spongiiphila]VVS93869.1 di-haem cytochrome transmembrane [Desulfoluna spongiiphila]
MNQPLYLFTRYERLWHWFQVVIITLLIVTGLEVHGSFSLMGFETAARVHNISGIAWAVAFAFFAFWIATTGEWKHYIPTTRKMALVIRHYAVGIFKGEPHPVPATERAKHNPLQRIVYLLFSALLLPSQMITGFLYYTVNTRTDVMADVSLKAIAVFHTVGALLVLAFVIMHVYMVTTGPTVFSHLKTMITGWEK